MRNTHTRHRNAGWWQRRALFCAVAVAFLSACQPDAPHGEALVAQRVMGESGDEPGQFGYPRCLASDAAAGQLWVIDKLARVQRIDAATGKSLEDWQTPKFDKGKPTGATVWRPAHAQAPNATPAMLIIADTHEHRVLCYALRDPPQSNSTVVRTPPTLVTTFGSFGEGDGQFIYTTDVAVLPTADGDRIEKLYVGEYGGNDRVHIWRAETAPDGSIGFIFERTFGHMGPSASADNIQFNRPHSLVIDAAQRQLILSDACNHRVGVFTLDGNLVRWFGKPASEGHVAGTGPGEFTYPYGIELLGDGTLMVCEFGNNRLQRLDLTTGACLGLFGQPGRARGQLSTPWACVSVGPNVYILDSGNSRLQMIEKPTGHPRALTDAQARTSGGGGG